jgi:hypothetical protein
MNFPSHSCYLQYRDRTERPTTWRGRRYWLVSRALCGFRVFRLPGTSRTDLKGFAAIKAREWAPYAEVGYHAHLTRDAARIWVWDAGRIRDAMLSTGVKPGRIAVLPEVALQARASNGPHLVTCLEGVEGQFWSHGELQASRWWPEMPSLEQWLEFQRASGLAADPLTASPPAETPPWRSRPWTNSGGGWGVGMERRARVVFAAGAGLLLAAYGYLGGSLVHDAMSMSAVEKRLEIAEQRSAPIIAERSRALANREFLDNFSKLDLYPSQFALFARVAEKFPANGSRLTAWSYQDGDLQFTILSPTTPDVLFYVKTYSSVEGFTEVAADRADSERGLRIKLRLARK